jgi:hypothetical protein
MEVMDEDKNELPCSEKLAFGSQQEASATATVARHRYGNELKPYKCKHCGLWHLASN